LLTDKRIKFFLDYHVKTLIDPSSPVKQYLTDDLEWFQKRGSLLSLTCWSFA